MAFQEILIASKRISRNLIFHQTQPSHTWENFGSSGSKLVQIGPNRSKSQLIFSRQKDPSHINLTFFAEDGTLKIYLGTIKSCQIIGIRTNIYGTCSI